MSTRYDASMDRRDGPAAGGAEVSEAAGLDSEPPSQSPQLDQEFLFHLYRGSELLQDNSVDEAKVELERALAFQPKEPQGQALLGIVYFRLGLYPRAIEIYEELERACPRDLPPKINLALCYLKTGQTLHARERLEQIVALDPTHRRAWGYLGLVYQRLGDFDKAQVAFERAERPKLAERMQQMRSMQLDDVPANGGAPSPPTALPELSNADVQRALAPPSVPPPSAPDAAAPPPAAELPKPPGVPGRHGSVSRPPTRGGHAIPVSVSPRSSSEISVPPRSAGPVAPGTRVIVPPLATRLVRDTEMVFPENPRVVLHANGTVLVRVDRKFCVRPEWIQAISWDTIPLRMRRLFRSVRAQPTDEPLGGATRRIVACEGSGRLVIAAQANAHLVVFGVDGERVYVREEHLVGFDGTIDYENGKLTIQDGDYAQMVQLTGSGSVIIQSRHGLDSLAVAQERPLLIRADQVMGWVGRLLPRSVGVEESPGSMPGFVSFSGDGAVLADLRN